MDDVGSEVRIYWRRLRQLVLWSQGSTTSRHTLAGLVRTPPTMTFRDYGEEVSHILHPGGNLEALGDVEVLDGVNLRTALVVLLEDASMLPMGVQMPFEVVLHAARERLEAGSREDKALSALLLRVIDKASSGDVIRPPG